MAFILIIFIISFFGLLWIYIAYLLFLYIITFFITKKLIKDHRYQPCISIMIMTYNEEKVIRKKIENTLALDYPAEKLDIMVVDSNSDDNTQSIVRGYATKNIRLIAQNKREGKASAVHYGIQQAKGEIIISTDANAFFSPDVLTKIIPYFADPKIGGATGAMMQVDKSKTLISKGGDLYWKMEKIMRRMESNLHSVIGMSGEICVFRRSLFQNINLQDWYKKGEADDFSLGFHIIFKGYRIAYVPEAFVWEPAPDNLKDFFQQKVKTVTMTIQSLFNRPSLIGLKYGLYSALIFPSRKVLPLFSPLFLLAMIITNIYIFNQHKVFMIFLIFQIFIYFLAVLGFIKYFNRIIIVRVANFFILLNVAVIIGWLKFIGKKDFTIWDQIKSSR